MAVSVEHILSDLIRIESVNPPGGELAVAQYLKNLFDEYHIENEILESKLGRGNFIARLGTGKKSLLYSGHIDVVPAGEGWSFSPFSGEIKDGFVFGRGALDCKGLVAAEVCAIINLAESGSLNGRLIFAATADEEAGSVNGMEWLVANYPEKVRADFSMNEGAEAPAKIGKKVVHSLVVGEKGPAWMKLKSKGVAGHGSVPNNAQNAVVKMSKVLSAMADYKPEIILTPESRFYLETIFGLCGIDEHFDESNVDKLINKVPDKTLATYMRTITRMTISPNMVNGGLKTNIIPAACEAQVDIRVLPGQNGNYIRREFGKLLEEIEITPIQYQDASYSSADTEYYRLVRDTLQEFIGDGVIVPTICTGATDSRFLRSAGMLAYGTGVMTLNLDKEMDASVHGVNEKVDVASLKLKTKFFETLARRYLS